MNTEIWLVKSIFGKTWETDISNIGSCSRMLEGHKYFHSKPLPDKTNERIFLKSPKTLFLDHFWPFLVIFAKRYFQKIELCHAHGPLTPYNISEKTNQPIPWKLPERRTNRRKTLIYWNLPAMTGGPKRRLGGIMVLIHNTLENILIKTKSTQRKVKIKNMRLRNFLQIKFLSLDKN